MSSSEQVRIHHTVAEPPCTFAERGSLKASSTYQRHSSNVMRFSQRIEFPSAGSCVGVAAAGSKDPSPALAT